MMNVHRAVVLCLIGVAGCGRNPAAPDDPPHGLLRIEVTTTGTDFDRFGYSVSVNGAYAGHVPANGSLEVDLPPDSYAVELHHMQSNCALQGEPPRAQVEARSSVTVRATVNCGALPSASGHIVWLRDRAVWMARPDMTEVRMVVPAPQVGGWRFGMSVSRDGKWIAFTERLADQTNPDIMVTTFNGDAPRSVAASQHRDQMPEWTADGRLLFLSNRRGAGNDLFISGVSGSAPELVAENVHLPSVSPDGTRILFTRSVAGHADVYVMDLNGSGVTRLTSGSFYESEARWSPDGSRIAFIAQPDPNYDIYLMNTDGSNRVRMTRSAERVPSPFGGGWDAMPRWSPDGERLIFETRFRVGWWDVLVLDLGTGAEVRLIAEDFVSNQNPIWVP
jgi:hypothetical protein